MSKDGSYFYFLSTKRSKNVNQVDVSLAGKNTEPDNEEKQESIHEFDAESSISEMSNNMI